MPAQAPLASPAATPRIRLMSAAPSATRLLRPVPEVSRVLLRKPNLAAPLRPAAHSSSRRLKRPMTAAWAARPIPMLPARRGRFASLSPARTIRILSSSRIQAATPGFGAPHPPIPPPAERADGIPRQALVP